MQAPRLPAVCLLLALSAPLALAQDAAARKAEIEKALTEKKVTFQFLSTPVGDALGYLSKRSGINILLSGRDEGEEPVTFSGQDMPLGRAIRWVAFLADLSYEVVEHGVYVASSDEIDDRRVSAASFDVRDLTLETLQFPGPDLAYGSDLGGPGIFGDEDESLSIDFLIGLIEETIEPDSWDSPFTISGGNGVLHVRHVPEVLEEIGSLLEDIRHHKARMVAVEGRLYRIDGDVWAEAFADGDGNALTLFDAEGHAALRRQLEEKGLRPVHVLRTTGSPGQRVHALAQSARGYLRDVDVSIAQGAVAIDPIRSRLLEGAVLDVRPIPSPSGDSVTLRLLFQTAEATLDRTVEFGPTDRRPEGQSPTRIELPRVDHIDIQTSVRVADRGALAISLTHVGRADARQRYVLLVSPQVIESK